MKMNELLTVEELVLIGVALADMNELDKNALKDVDPEEVMGIEQLIKDRKEIIRKILVVVPDMPDPNY